MKTKYEQTGIVLLSLAVGYMILGTFFTLL